jgi:DNA replication protein DnaC
MNPAADIDLPRLLKRLHLPTIARLLPDLEACAAAEGMGLRDALALLCAEEVANRNNTRIQKAMRNARFPFLITIEEFDFTFGTGLRRDLLAPYLGREFVTEGRNLILSGKSGRGKTALAIATAIRAIQNGFDARFTTAAALIDDLVAAAQHGGLAAATAAYRDPDVLIIDEVGYLPYVETAANVLYGVVDGRYLDHRPIIFTTNKSLDQWGQVLHDDHLAEALLDRVLERGRLLPLTGPSYRTRHLAQESQNPAKSHNPSAGGHHAPPRSAAQRASSGSSADKEKPDLAAGHP